LFYSEALTRLIGKLIGNADQISGYGFSSTNLGNKAAKTLENCTLTIIKVQITSMTNF